MKARLNIRWLTVVLTTGLVVIIAGVMQSPVLAQDGENDWPMVGANPQRSSWTAEEVGGNLRVEWYRPIEAYISQNVQIIASDGLLFVSTARGLYALNAVNGQVVWRFDTELPLGNSPTVADGVIYVGGYDRKLHALNAQTGAHLWVFAGAGAGFSTNPLVVEGKVIAGNRDGYLYAIGAHGSSNQGKLLWRHKTDGPILQSAAYNDGVIYFASNDMHAYAVDAGNGALVWKSDKLPGDQFQSYWPVVFQDKVIFSTSDSYRPGLNPGTNSIEITDPDIERSRYDLLIQAQKDDLFFDKLERGALIGPTVSIDEPWAEGKTVIDASRITEYLEENPNTDHHLHKPWRRIYIVLNASDGSEYTFDSDGDGYPEYAPVAYWGAKNVNVYPPLVGLDGLLYQTNVYSNYRVRVMGWKLGTPYLTLEQGDGDVPEPQAISAGGNLIYRSICCDRVGDYFNIETGSRPGILWDYSNTLASQAPGYDEMWWGIEYPSNMSRLVGAYGNRNGIYHSHGDQNPLIPYNGRVYTHRSNAIIAYGPGSGPGRLPLLTIRAASDQVTPPDTSDLRARLEAEIQAVVDAGNLNPEYYNVGQLLPRSLKTAFENPGDTIYTLARSYPYLSTSLQQQTRDYLRDQFAEYFDPNMYARKGWSEGGPRESMMYPPEVQASMATLYKRPQVGGWSWFYPQHNFYAMWKYAEIFPPEADRVYDLAKSKLQVPVPDSADFVAQPYEHNAYIAGYIGFLKLQELAGKADTDVQLRSQVSDELDRLLQLRSTEFEKDTPWADSTGTYPDDRHIHWRSMNVARNFLYLVPELGDHLYQNARPKVTEALDEYNWVAPYWFVSRYEGAVDEGVMSVLYNYALFQAKAYALKEPYEELTKYLDVPAFHRGDLYYIQNLIAALDVSDAPPAPTCRDLDGNGVINVIDIMLVVVHQGGTNPTYDLDGNGIVDMADVDFIVSCWQQLPKP